MNPIASIPLGIEVSEKPGAWWVSWNWRTPAALYPAVLGVGMGWVSVRQILQLWEGEGLSWLGWLNALTFCAASTIGLGVAALLHWGFRAEVVPPLLHIHWGPLRVGRPVAVEEVVDVQGSRWGPGGKLLLRLWDGRILARGLTQTEEQAQYVAQLLQRQLGLAQERVRSPAP